MNLANIRSCLDVTDALIESALSPAASLTDPPPREKVTRLLEHMASVARPGRGAPKILIVIAHMATRDWIEGELVVRLLGDDDLTVLELHVDDGLNATRMLGPVRIDVPFDEFRAALNLRPDVILPLWVEGEIEERRVTLRTTAELRRTSQPPGVSAVASDLMIHAKERPLPEIVSRPPEALADAAPQPTPAKKPPPLPPTARAAPPPAAQPAETDTPQRPAIKPMSMPPHMKHALAGLKKKPKGE